MTATIKEKWDDRYGKKELAYGEEPNHYLKGQLSQFSPGTILFPAEGEGRNAVYAATLGWSVCAFDLSAKGKKKAPPVSSGALSRECNKTIECCDDRRVCLKGRYRQPPPSRAWRATGRRQSGKQKPRV